MRFGPGHNAREHAYLRRRSGKKTLCTGEGTFARDQIQSAAQRVEVVSHKEVGFVALRTAFSVTWSPPLA